MVSSEKKKRYFLPTIVSLLLFTLCLNGWSQAGERLLSYLGDSYILNVNINTDLVQLYLDEHINPILMAEGQSPLTAYPTGLVMINDRDNLRDGFSGEFIGTGEAMAINFFLVALDPSPPAGICLLLVKGFNSNQTVIDYFADHGLFDPDQEASAVYHILETEREETTTIKTKTQVIDEGSTVEFTAKFVAPEPYGEPLAILSPDLVGTSPYKLRFAYAPARAFTYSLSRAVYEPAVSDVNCALSINILDPNVGDIFNAINQTHVTRFRFMQQIQVIDEIIE